ncbi:unnamed protein product [Durusdinium trenchii]|uniref:SAM domain-containing protein n=1 Tax=Durusdinium trenchii TaxID=1381693 RepID=A0ABP0ITN7_9DINO
MVHPGVSVTELLPVPTVEDSELLKLLRSAGLEEWYSKFLSLGCVTIEDLRHMDERRMDEMGLRAGHRIRLDGVLPTPKTTPRLAAQELESPQPPLCQEENCKQMAKLTCGECKGLLCSTHAKRIQQRHKDGGTTIIREIPSCPACYTRRKKTDQCNTMFQCAAGVCVVVLGAGITVSFAYLMRVASA